MTLDLEALKELAGRATLRAGAIAALEAANSVERAVLWPQRDCKKIHRIQTAPDGRTHFVVPSGDALELFAEDLIDRHGEITDAGRRAALSPTPPADKEG